MKRKSKAIKLKTVGVKELLPTCAPGWFPTNPSLCMVPSSLFGPLPIDTPLQVLAVNCRLVNYSIHKNHYRSREYIWKEGVFGMTYWKQNVFKSENILLCVHPDTLAVIREYPIRDERKTKNPDSRNQGIEDLKLFWGWREHLYGTFNVNDQFSSFEKPKCQIGLAQLDFLADGTVRIEQVSYFPTQKDVEKNWLPLIHFPQVNHLAFVYTLDPFQCLLLHPRSMLPNWKSILVSGFHSVSKLNLGNFACEKTVRNSTGPLLWNSGYLFVGHHILCSSPKTYTHIFLWFDSDFILQKRSPFFVLEKSQIEYVNGALYWPERQLVYLATGIVDNYAKIFVVESQYINDLLK